MAIDFIDGKSFLNLRKYSKFQKPTSNGIVVNLDEAKILAELLELNDSSVKGNIAVKYEGKYCRIQKLDKVMRINSDELIELRIVIDGAIQVLDFYSNSRENAEEKAKMIKMLKVAAFCEFANFDFIDGHNETTLEYVHDKWGKGFLKLEKYFMAALAKFSQLLEHTFTFSEIADFLTMDAMKIMKDENNIKKGSLIDFYRFAFGSIFC